MNWTWIDYTVIGTLFLTLTGTIGTLCAIIWSNLGKKIEQLREKVAEHDSEVNDNAASLQAIELILIERKEDHERRFGDIGQTLLRIEIKVGDIMKEVLQLLSRGKK